MATMFFVVTIQKKGGGIAINVKKKNELHATILSSVSLSGLLALKFELLKGHFITAVGCYRPPVTR